MKALPLKYGAFALLGVVVGVFSGLFGVGGGIIMVPFLVIVAGYTQQVAQGISLAVIIPTALSGVADYWQKGTLNMALVPLAIALAVGSIPSAKYGAALAQRLPQDTLKTLFALFMVAMAARIMPSNSLRSMSLLLGMSFLAVGVRLLLVR
ncbi:MAG: sulfite exporter TauE/SafE family protein [Armatimonadota bacterium]